MGRHYIAERTSISTPDTSFISSDKQVRADRDTPFSCGIKVALMAL